MSTPSLEPCICFDDNCTSHRPSMNVYPGQSFEISVAAVDGFGRKVFTLMSFDLTESSEVMGLNNVIHPNYWTITPHQALLSRDECTNVSITFHNMDGNRLHFANPALNLYTSFYAKLQPNVQLQFINCPLGFKLTNTSGEYSCHCTPVLVQYSQRNGYQIPQCLIHSFLLTHEENSPLVTIEIPESKSPFLWIGLMTYNNTTVFGVARTCYSYCNFLHDKFNVFVINDTNIAIADPKRLSSIAPLCLDNRYGPLCSTCDEGYSVVFDSTECKQCSNWWLLTLLVYALMGPLLIYMLYALRLTLTDGTLNGIIFYAQMIGVFQTLVPHSFHYYLLTTGFISLINLSFNFNYPLCFYDGMTQLWKSGLSLIFPIYLLFIVILVIIISHHSVRISNRIADSSLQVLVTVVHLSFTRLLTSVMDVFTPIDIYTNATEAPLKVWYNDGTVEYGKGGHLILMIITGATIGPIILAYITILIAGRPLQRINKLREYLRPVHEAIHAPYKENKEFSFSLSLLIVVALYLIYSFYTGDKISQGYAISIPIVILYLIFTAYLSPFKTKLLNALNTFIHFMIGIAIGSVWYFLEKGTDIFLHVFHSIVLLTLAIIVICHIPIVERLLKKVRNKLGKHLPGRLLVEPAAGLNKRERRRQMMEGSFFDDSSSAREPLIYD